MVRYARSLNVDIKYVNDKAMALVKGTWCDNQCELQKKLYQLCVERDVEASKELTVQGCYLNLENVHIKSSHSIYYNWKVDDALVILQSKRDLAFSPLTLLFTCGIETTVQNARSVTDILSL